MIELFAGLLPFATAAAELSVALKASYSFETDSDSLVVTRVAHPCTIELGDVQVFPRAGMQDLVQEHGRALYLLTGSLSCAHSPPSGGRSGAEDLRGPLDDFKRLWLDLQEAVASSSGAVCEGLLHCGRLGSYDRVPWKRSSAKGLSRSTPRPSRLSSSLACGGPACRPNGLQGLRFRRISRHHECIPPFLLAACPAA